MKTYFISNNVNSYIKIGISHNPEIRIKQISGQCNWLDLKLLYKIEGDHERLLHNHYKEYRKEGEWFDISFNKEEVDSLIEVIVKEDINESLVAEEVEFSYLDYQEDPEIGINIRQSLFKELKANEIGFIIFTSKYIVYNTNQIKINSEKRVSLCKQLYVSEKELNKIIYSLYNREVILKIDDYLYFNPDYVYYGD